ncbi:hypothetical protein L21SP4_01943 [Kiritimatiella glycovorans]|uniref:Zinc-finger domain-containing protein n=2 Tax=Kiritimatiella glycovorans TaxID=1307763 RepID=A0A0G3EFQ2_9BACT|nr:hypothetical protein L21SP4_01943 [Kiritimatiella glycovorans]
MRRELDGDPGPELKQHLETCGGCRDLWHLQSRTRAWCSLKAYETPRRGLEDRAAARIMSVVRAETEKGRERERRWMWFFAEPRYGLALLFILFLALNLLGSGGGTGRHLDGMVIEADRVMENAGGEQLLSRMVQTNETAEEEIDLTPESPYIVPDRPGGNFRYVGFEE